MNKRVRNMKDGAAIGGVMGAAIGTIFQGISLVVPGKREVIIARAVAVIVPKTITLSGAAVGTLIGGVLGGLQRISEGTEGKCRHCGGDIKAVG